MGAENSDQLPFGQLEAAGDATARGYVADLGQNRSPVPAVVDTG
jgi:hypothetical protein